MFTMTCVPKKKSRKRPTRNVTLSWPLCDSMDAYVGWGQQRGRNISLSAVVNAGLAAFFDAKDPAVWESMLARADRFDAEDYRQVLKALNLRASEAAKMLVRRASDVAEAHRPAVEQK